MDILYYFLPMILFLGIITSYQDIKFGKIRNKWIILGLIYSLIVNFILIFYNYYHGILNYNYFFELLTNFLFSIIIGFGFWYYNIWSAGDGKLFITYICLIPLSYYSLGYHKGLPGINLLFNLFIISLIYMLFLLIKNFEKKQIKILKKAIISSFSIKEIGKALFYFFTIYWIIELVFNFFNIQNIILYFIISLFLFSKIRENNKILFPILTIIFILRLIFDKEIYSFNFIKFFFLYGLLWKTAYSIINGTFSKFTSKLFYEEILANDLKEGMILFEDIKRERKLAKGQKGIKKGNYYYFCEEKGENSSNLYINPETEGINKFELNKIKKIGFSKIRVSLTTPFALLMFISLIVTLLTKGNLLIYLRTFLF